jgi:hypothetical protein
LTPSHLLLTVEWSQRSPSSVNSPAFLCHSFMVLSSFFLENLWSSKWSTYVCYPHWSIRLFSTYQASTSCH